MASLPRFVQALLAAISLSPALPAAADCPPLLNYRVARFQDGAPQSLYQYQGKVIPVMNTASSCVFTRPYEGLEYVYDKYLISGDGSNVGSYSSLTAPGTRTLVAHIDRWLAEKP